jgi:phosphatidylglycerophosphate synthase
VRVRRLEAVVGASTTAVLLAVLFVGPGLGPAGWAVGLATGWGATALLAVALRRTPHAKMGPADWITLTRAVLIAGIAGLVADSFGGSDSTTAVVVLACIALVLDTVDGQVARRTGTAKPFGARFDGEVDAFLILVLSIEVSRDYGNWVLAIGAARYVLLIAGWVFTWLAAPLPARFWGKVVAAVQGIVLTVAASGLLSRPVGMIAVGIALLLLAESFGHSVLWLYRTGAGPVTRRVVRRSTAVIAAAVVWAVLVAPDRLDHLTPAAFVGIPVEGLAVVAVGLFLPTRGRRALAVVAGFAFALVTIAKLLDMAFNAELDRPFNAAGDWTNLGLGIGVVRDSIGARATDTLLMMVVLGLLLMVVVVIASTLYLSNLTARHPRSSARGVTALGLLWVVSAAMSLHVAGTSVASLSTAQLAVTQVYDAEAAIRDAHHFESALHSPDPYTQIPSRELLSELRGKDVLLVFVESYGQVAVQGTSFSPGVDSVLRSGNTALARAGYSARSAYLTSPTFGGMSWVAHSTLQSGLWIDSQQRFDALMSSDRLTLSSAFGKAGWRTVSDNPADKHPFTGGTTFYHYNQLYGRLDQGYQGPTFSWAAMPDQYTLAEFQQLELGRGHAPVMAEIDLVSSHTPWTPLPRMVPWNRLGNGSIFDPMPAEGLSPGVAWRDSDTVRRLYGQSVQYSMHALISWITRLHDNNLVVMLLGDHQPATTVSGYDASHDVPISIVAHDPSVTARIARWRWQQGLLPSPAAPVWRMDAFRNRFINSFSTGHTANTLRPAR